MNEPTKPLPKPLPKKRRVPNVVTRLPDGRLVCSVCGPLPGPQEPR